MITIATPSGTVRAIPSEADATGAVRYTLTGAAKGTIHVTATHNPSRWDQFDAIRASLGSVNDMRELPAEPLVRIRGRACLGSMLRLLGHPADLPWGWQGPAPSLVDTDDRPAPPQAAQTLTALMRACASDYAARCDLAHLRRAARSHEAPQLLKWLDAVIAYAERELARQLRESEAHRVQASRSLAAWWTVARWFTALPHPVLALLLMPYRESLAHRAEYLPTWAAISAREADDQRRHLTHYRGEREGLLRPVWHVEEASADPGDRSDIHDEYAEDARDSFGSVEIVYASSPEAAAERARQEARETSERIHRELARQ
ncbi:hypothetical protein [Streptomyces sp. NPDC002540]